MSPNDSVELLFKCRLEGFEGLDKATTSVRGVSAAAATSSEALMGLEKSIQALTAATTEHTAALSGMEGGFTRTTAAASGLAGGTRAITNEMRMLEGAMPIRAAASFLAQMQGVNAVMAAAFPIFGAVALIGVLDTILEKTGIIPKHWLDSSEAEKEATKEAKKYADEAERGLAAIKKLNEELYTKQHGKEAGTAFSTQDLAEQARIATQRARQVQDEAAVLRKFIGITESGATPSPLTEEEGRLLRLATGGALNEGSPFGAHEQGIAKSYSQKIGDSLGGEVRAANIAASEADERLRNATTQPGVDPLEAAKKRDEEAKKRRQELNEAEKRAASDLREAQTAEYTGIQRINEQYRQKLEWLNSISASQKAYNDEAAAHLIRVQTELSKMQGRASSALAGLTPEMAGFEKYDSKQFLEGLRKQIEEYKKDVDTALRVLQRADQSDADAVQRRVGVTLRADSIGVRNGSMTGSQGASADYQARITAANEVFTIETRGLYLIDDKQKREERLADARKKWADEVYRAEEQYENQLQELREKDLEKYRSLAGSLFDAIHHHTTNQWGREFVLGQARQVFENVTTAPLQQIGHVLGSVTGGWNPGGILTGTVFDPKNKGVDEQLSVAKNTETHTKDTATWLGKIYSAISGQPVSSNASPADVMGLPSTFNASTSMLSLMGLGGGSTAAGVGSGFVGGGMFGGGTNPIGAILSGQASGPGWGANLSTGQRVGLGAEVGAAVAMGTMQAVKEFSQGGAGGVLGGISAVAGMASLIPGAGAIAAPIAAVTGLLGSLFSTGPQQRAKDIYNALSSNQYLAPTAMNVTQGMSGTYQDFDARGNLRTSNLSAVPMVAEPYITSRVVNGQRTYYDAPGQTLAPFTMSQPSQDGSTIVNHNYAPGAIQAMDSESFHAFVNKRSNAAAVGDAVTAHLQGGGGGRLADEIHRHVGGR